MQGFEEEGLQEFLFPEIPPVEFLSLEKNRIPAIQLFRSLDKRSAGEMPFLGREGSFPGFPKVLPAKFGIEGKGRL